MYSEIMKNSPAVFAVADTYQIMVGVTCQTMMWVKVGEECYYDHSNGIMRSAVTMHRVTVPREELDAAGGYTVFFEKIIDRKPYFPETEEPVSQFYEFRPVRSGAVKAYQIADAHNQVKGPIAAAKAFTDAFGEMDFLIMNGDIPNHSGDVAYFDTIYEIAAGITHGNIPIVFARGNHDLRGVHAEEIASYTPNHLGNSYYSFRIGDIWGLALDCGEDKEDWHAEYGHTVCCHAFRREETKFIENIIKNADSEYKAEGVKRRIVVMHNPFTIRHSDPFNIEPEIFTDWSNKLKNEIGIDVMICGHLHKMFVAYPGDESDLLGHPSPIIIGSWVDYKSGAFKGVGVFFGEDIECVFTSSDGSVGEIIKV